MNKQIDGAALRKYCTDNTLTFTELGFSIGRSASYISKVITNGYMLQSAYDHMIHILGLPEGSFEPKVAAPVVKEAEVAKGYRMVLDCWPDKVRVKILFDDEELYTGYSRVKNNTELGLMQAISYASHMCYKKAEQAALDEEAAE